MADWPTHLDPLILRAAQSLTPREREALSRTISQPGIATTRDLAHAMSISVTTARTHIDHVLNKLGVNSQVRAVVFVVRHNLINVHTGNWHPAVLDTQRQVVTPLWMASATRLLDGGATYQETARTLGVPAETLHRLLPGRSRWLAQRAVACGITPPAAPAEDIPHLARHAREPRSAR